MVIRKTIIFMFFGIIIFMLLIIVVIVKALANQTYLPVVRNESSSTLTRTQTSTLTRTQTSTPTRTQTPTPTRTQTLTPTRTQTLPPTTQATKTPTPTHTRIPIPFPLTGILDDFNRGNEGPPPSANWDIVQHGHVVLNQQCIGVDDSDDNLSAWNTSFNTPIEAYLTISSNPDESVFSIYMLHNYYQIPNEDGYECWFDTITNKLHICRVDNQVETQLGSLINITGIAINDSVGMSVQNGVIQAWWKPSGGSWTLLGERSDSIYDGPYYIIPETWKLGIFDNFGGGTIP
jgi:hypothetical protein